MARIALSLPLLLMAAPVPAQQQQQGLMPEADEKPSEIMVKEKPTQRRQPDRFSIDTGMRVAGQYISRGVAFSEEPSLQPYVTLTIALPELSGGPFEEVRWFVGNWNSFQFGGPGLGQENRGTLSGWYEADLYTGVSAELAPRWSMSAAYYYYHSPAHSFRGYSDFEWIMSYDDTGQWEGILPLKDFTLAPSLRITQEVGRPGRADALYIQPSLTASLNLGREDRPVWFRIPLVLGLSDDYYDSANGGKVTFGYFRTGVTIATPAFELAGNPFMVGGGVDIWMLNDKVVNGLNDNELVWRFGFRWSF